MRPIPFNPDVRAPRVAVAGALPGAALAKLTVEQLCQMADIPMRASGGVDHAVVCIAGSEHWIVGPHTYYVGVGAAWNGSRTEALRVLEVLAHGFHDYAARECVCGRGLFVAPARAGRPPIGSRPMTARERMARMRQKRGAMVGT